MYGIHAQIAGKLLRNYKEPGEPTGSLGAAPMDAAQTKGAWPAVNRVFPCPKPPTRGMIPGGALNAKP